MTRLSGMGPMPRMYRVRPMKRQGRISNNANLWCIVASLGYCLMISSSFGAQKDASFLQYSLWKTMDNQIVLYACTRISARTKSVISGESETETGRVDGGNLSSTRVEGHKIENIKRSKRKENSNTVLLYIRYLRCLLSTMQPDTSFFFPKMIKV